MRIQVVVGALALLLMVAWQVASRTDEVGISREEPPADRAAAVDPIGNVRMMALPNGTATVAWTTTYVATGLVHYGRNPSRLDHAITVGSPDTRHEVMLPDLESDRTYHLRITAIGGDGSEQVHPAESRPPLVFQTPNAGVADTTVTDFLVGEADGIAVVGSVDGSLQLTATLQDDFRRALSWPAIPVSEGGGVDAYAGQLVVDRAALVDDRVLPPTHPTLRARATFTASEGQYLGVGALGDGQNRAVFRTDRGVLLATTERGEDMQESALDVSADVPHELEIAWRRDVAEYRVDGAIVARHDLAAPQALVLMAGDQGAGEPLSVDEISGGEYRREGIFTSRVIDAEAMVTWRRATWEATTPSGTAVEVEVRTGSRRMPDDSWTSWRLLRGDGDTIGGSSRYLQYQVRLRSDDGVATPVVHGLGFTHDGETVGRHHGETG
jgi:hypothetical protein